MTDQAERPANPLAKFDEGVLKNIESVEHASGVPRAMFLPASLGEAMEISKLMAAGIAVPPFLRGKPADCLAVVFQASRWGLDPFAVAGKCYFVNDRLAFEAQLVAAVLNNSRILHGALKTEWFGEGDGLRCTVSGSTVRDPENTMTATQAIARIKTRNSPLWKDHPEQQLAYYTQRAWARLHTPEVIMGVYTPDEIETIVPQRTAIPAPTRAGVGNYNVAEDLAGGGTVIDAEAKDDPATWTEELWQQWVLAVMIARDGVTNQDDLDAYMKVEAPTLDAAPPHIRKAIENHEPTWMMAASAE